MIRAGVFAVVSLSFAQVAAAHHGGGTFDGSKEVELTGKLTRLDLINPHSWIYGLAQIGFTNSPTLKLTNWFVAVKGAVR